MKIPPDDVNEQHVVNYVPDEICVVASTSTRGIDDVAGFYEHVRARLNLQIATLLKPQSRRQRPLLGALEADLEPVVLRKRFAGNATAVLQPLRRSGGQRDAGDDKPPASSPWVQLRAGRSVHLYFALDGEQRDVASMDLQQLRVGLESVRELNLLLNRFVRSTSQEEFQGVPWVVQACSPNWLTIAYQFGCGCPAGLPLPETTDHQWRLQFSGPLLEALHQPKRGDVAVAVLDTCPSQAALDAAVDRYPHNQLLGAVHADVAMDTPACAPAGFADHLAGCLPRLQWDMQQGPVHDHPEQFEMADHGLFVTGIVHDALAGSGRVYLVRVLNEYGIGDVLTISRALAAVPDLLHLGEARLVINVSLGIDLPIPERLLDRWFPATAVDPEVLRSGWPDIWEFLELLHANLEDVVQALSEQGILVVAASGNDALREDVDPANPPPPRFPARYTDVLGGLAATRRNLLSAADYSNRGELSSASWPGHVSTFGGNVKRANASHQPATTDLTDSVVGIFSSEALPGGAANPTGWVRWSGTSFSTPIIAGVAARLWTTRPDLAPLDLVAWLRSFAHPPHGGADPDAPLEVPVLDVKQS